MQFNINQPPPSSAAIQKYILDQTALIKKLNTNFYVFAAAIMFDFALMIAGVIYIVLNHKIANTSFIFIAICFVLFLDLYLLFS